MQKFYEVTPSEKTKGLFIAAFIKDAIQRANNLTPVERHALSLKAHMLADEVQQGEVADVEVVCKRLGVAELAKRALQFIGMLQVTRGKFSEDDRGCQLYKKLIEDQIAEGMIADE